VKNVARGLLILLLALLVACPQNPPVPPPSGFNIELRFLPGFPTEAKVFMQARARFWEQVIIGDIPDVSGVVDTSGCNFVFEQVPSPYVLPPVTEVDDLVLYVGLKPTIFDPNHPDLDLSDGPGKNLAVGSVCAIRSEGINGNLPLVSKIEFDPADIPSISTPSQQLDFLKDTAIHEMGHALGFGTIWDLYPGLKLATPDGTPCGNNSEFTGLNAKREYERLGGTGNVPVAPSKERGSCGHWAEGMFDDEIMTPLANPNQISPLSRLTIAAMADLGYTVSYTNADNYRLSLPAPTTDYSIDLVIDRNIPRAYEPYFYAAAKRWQKIITGDIPDMHGIFDPIDGNCKIDHQSKFSGIDDIKIFIDIVPSTQNGGLGGNESLYKRRIEPCLNRVGSFLPAIGVMQYDPGSLSSIYPLLQSTNPSDAEIVASKAVREITRDMGFALGFGRNWVEKGLVMRTLYNPFYDPFYDVNLCSTRSANYTGINALREYHLLSSQPLGFITVTRNKLPLYFSQNCDGWVFLSSLLGNELMGGNQPKLNPGLPDTSPALSKITIGAMQDLGYTVDYSVADPFDDFDPPTNPNCDPPLVTSGCLTSINPP
jgi:Leishmanolysin